MMIRRERLVYGRRYRITTSTRWHFLGSHNLSGKKAEYRGMNPILGDNIAMFKYRGKIFNIRLVDVVDTEVKNSGIEEDADEEA